MYDLIIIGGGPAGVAAGIYATRKLLNTLLITESLEGQSAVSPEIQNWIGEISISGNDLAKKLAVHLRSYEGNHLTIKTHEKINSLSKTGEIFIVKSDQGEYQAKTVLIAAGSKRRKLEIKGTDIFEQKGVTYCASCDGPLFTDQKVAVIGGGNAGFSTAGQLLAYCQNVTLLETASDFRAEKITIEKLRQNPKFQALANVDLLEIKGDKFVNGLVYKNKTNGEQVELPVTGIFVEIGLVPNTEIFKGIVDLNQHGEIVIDHKKQTTSGTGIWAAGDCTDILYRQNNIAAGDAAKAVEDVYNFLQRQN